MPLDVSTIGQLITALGTLCLGLLAYRVNKRGQQIGLRNDEATRELERDKLELEERREQASSDARRVEQAQAAEQRAWERMRLLEDDLRGERARSAGLADENATLRSLVVAQIQDAAAGHQPRLPEQHARVTHDDSDHTDDMGV